METNQSDNNRQELDIIAWAARIWNKRRFILKWMGIAAAAGLVVAFSIPKEYTTVVKLSSENAAKGGDQLGGLAAMAGINLGSGGGNQDALPPDLYPDIVNSTPFLLELLPLEVETRQGETLLFSDYMLERQRIPWWSTVAGAPLRAVGWVRSLFGKKPSEPSGKPLDTFRLTPQQEAFVGAVRSKVQVAVDKTGVIQASVTAQDPLISATVMQVVLNNLQEYITDYRTRKAKHDLAFSEKLYGEARDKYYAVQKKYARYVDENKNIVPASFRIGEERLRNEMALAYSVYGQMAQQLEMDKIKVQQQTPVYTVIEPPRVPSRPSKPGKATILAVFIVLGALGSIGWILGKQFVLSEEKENIK